MLRHSQIWSSLVWTVPDLASPKLPLGYLAPLLGLYAVIGVKPYQSLLLPPLIWSTSGDFCMEAKLRGKKKIDSPENESLRMKRIIPNWDGDGHLEKARVSTWCLLIGSWPSHHLYLLEGLSFSSNSIIHPSFQLNNTSVPMKECQRS